MDIARNAFGIIVFATVMFLVGYLACYSTVSGEQTRTDGQRIARGTEPHYVIVTSIEQKAYKAGKQISIETVQELVGVKVDGKAGWETMKEIMLLNSLDEIK